MHQPAVRWIVHAVIAVATLVGVATVTEAARPRAPSGPWRAALPPALADISAGASPSTIVYGGILHVFSYDAAGGNLHLATWDRATSTWTSQVLDGAGGVDGRVDSDVGIGPSAVIWEDRVHVFYGDATRQALRRARLNKNGVWRFFDVVVTGSTSSRGGGETAVVLDGGKPHVFYHDVAEDSLRHAQAISESDWAGGRVDGRVVSGVPGSIDTDVGSGVSAVLSDGSPHAFYYDETNGDLRHVWRGSSGWRAETLDGTNGADVGRDTASLIWGPGPQVYYFDATNGNLKRARWNGSSWAVQTVDGHSSSDGRIDGVVGTGASAFVRDGQPHVAYHDATNRDLRLARISDGAWNYQTLDGDGTHDGRTTDVVGVSTAMVSYYGDFYVFSEAPASGLLGASRLRRSWRNAAPLTVTIVTDSMLSAYDAFGSMTAWWPRLSNAIEGHPDLRVGAVWSGFGTTAVAGPHQHEAVADGHYRFAPTDVLLVSFAFNDLNPRPFWGANADATALAWAQLAITFDAKAAGYRCVIWLQQRSDFNGELVTRHGFTASQANTMESRLAANRSNLSLLRSTILEQEAEFRVGLVDWAGKTNGPTDNTLFVDGVHPSGTGGEWIGQEAAKAMAECQ
jgi:hypothetical protein